jgi:CRISPR/Cas system-associated exonuclease Cas4 (RecB family)
MGFARLCTSTLAADRLAAARAFLTTALADDARALIVAATRGAADDLARDVAVRLPATFGLERCSLTQLAARLARVPLASEGKAPATTLTAEAVAARATFEALREGALGYFEPAASTPGFPRALARTTEELRLAGIDEAGLVQSGGTAVDLAGLAARVNAGMRASSSSDRAELFRTATTVAATNAPAEILVLVDPILDHAAERRFVASLIGGARTTFITMPASDEEAVAYLMSLGAELSALRTTGTNDLACLRRNLFALELPREERALDGSLEFFSAPGEGRESVEIARRILREARAGVRFDEMAILVRSPEHYLGLIEHALHRAGVPAWFSRGTRRPHPAGRAFLALLACRAERLSATRFAEYLSLAQVPRPNEEATPWVGANDELYGRMAPVAADSEPVAPPDSTATEADAIVGGTLRAPWRWERLLVEASVVGRDARRWRRRLEGLELELDRQIREASREDGGDDARVQILTETRNQLQHLASFALPVVEELAAWPTKAAWGEWLDRFEHLIPRVLRTPAQVLGVLAELRPMAAVGPVDLAEVRRVLIDRLLALDVDPPSRRFGRVFVGTPQQARGRSFRVAFVPGLAERMFPRKPREDPLMPDAVRETLGALLPTQRHRRVAERRLLQLVAGVASERLYVSYPRIELSESRARVPSFYALDVIRAASLRVPRHEWLEARAREVGDATLAWPAPSRPDDAIDEQEHDLAVLRGLLDDPNPEAVKGHAHYLLKLNDRLRRSVVERWSRGQRQWLPSDGIVRVRPQTREALEAQRLTSRAYSVSALQVFSACPYQFLLSAVHRLRALERSEPLQRMDPLTKGSLVHEMQARVFAALAARGALPVRAATLEAAQAVLDAVVDEVGSQAYDDLAPAVDRIWTDEMSSIRRDLHAWLHVIAHDEAWTPRYFEFGFGRVPGERDPHSVRQDVSLGGFLLRGAVDLIEEHGQTGMLRVTDHKTGRKPDGLEQVRIGGGALLQPVLYALAVEQALGREVRDGGLFYCTSTGGFTIHRIPLDDRSRAVGLEVLQIVDRAIERGFLPAAPTEHACLRCDFRAICGSSVVRRVARKPQRDLADLMELRSRA